MYLLYLHVLYVQIPRLYKAVTEITILFSLDCSVLIIKYQNVIVTYITLFSFSLLYGIVYADICLEKLVSQLYELDPVRFISKI